MAIFSNNSDSKTGQEIDRIKLENEELYEKVIKAYKTSETISGYIRQIAKNIEQICILYDQKEYISEICNRIIVHLRNLGCGKMDQLVYYALSGTEYEKYKHEQFNGRNLSTLTDLPEDISLEIKQITEAINLLKKARYSRYPDQSIQQFGYALHELADKTDRYQDVNNIINLKKDYIHDPLTENNRSSPYYPKRPLVQPPKDNEPNCISKQYEYLVEDVQNFVEDFLKHYYPPPEQRPFFAYAVKITRKLFSQYPSDKIHRDYKSWAEIHAADIGLHPSGKSAKEVSARYGSKIRRYDKMTGEPIFGRKGICKEQIAKKKTSLVEFMKEVYTCWPLFMLTSQLYSMTKEKLFVDHTIDLKPKRQWGA